jgi:hypothetical protein
LEEKLRKFRNKPRKIADQFLRAKQGIDGYINEIKKYSEHPNFFIDENVIKEAVRLNEGAFRFIFSGPKRNIFCPEDMDELAVAYKDTINHYRRVVKQILRVKTGTKNSAISETNSAFYEALLEALVEAGVEARKEKPRRITDELGLARAIHDSVMLRTPTHIITRDRDFIDILRNAFRYFDKETEQKIRSANTTVLRMKSYFLLDGEVSSSCYVDKANLRDGFLEETEIELP